MGGGWEGTVPLVPRNKWPFSHVPQKQNLDFLCSLFPKTSFVPLFPSFLDLCSLIPLKNMPSFPCSPKPLECLINSLQSWKCILRGKVGHFSSASKWKDGFTFSFNVEWIGLLNGTSTVVSVQHTTCDYSPSIISEVLTRWKLFIPYIMTGSNNYFTTYCPCHIFRSMFYLYHHQSRYETPQYKYLVIIARP